MIALLRNASDLLSKKQNSAPTKPIVTPEPITPELPVAIQPLQEPCPPWAQEWGYDQQGMFATVHNPWGVVVRLDAATIRQINQGQLPADGISLFESASAMYALRFDNIGLLARLTLRGQTQDFRYLPPGSFLMGSPDNEPDRNEDEGPRHRVTLTQGLWLADTTCTQAWWQMVMGDNPSELNGDQLPVENVSWDDVQLFLIKLQTYLPIGVQAFLPTEAEWEYACRAGSSRPFSFGDHISTAQANYDGNYPYNQSAKGGFRQTTLAVKALPANN